MKIYVLKKCKKTILLTLLFLLIPFISKAKFEDNPYYKYQDYLTDISYFPYTYNKTKGDGIVVAIIDSGVWLQHPDLINTNWVNNFEIPQNGIDDDNNGFIDDYYGWNFIDNNNDLTTKSSHGTAVAGIIAAQHNNEGIVGIAPNVKIMPLTVCDSEGCSPAAIKDAIIYATKEGADIINLSLGATNGYVGYSSLFDEAIKYAYDNDVLIVAAAGNGDPESSGKNGYDLNFSKVSPVNNDVDGLNMVLGVGALDISKNYADWSNYGAGVDLFAPGENIVTLSVPIYTFGNYEYDVMSGTSFSAPMVSAAAALLKSSKPELKNWEIIDMFSSFSKLDLDDVLEGQGPLRRCQLLDVNSNIGTLNDTLLFTGEHMVSDLDLFLMNQNSAISIDNNVLKFMDASNLKIKVSDFSVPAGTYTLKSRNSSCEVKDIKITIVGDDAVDIEPDISNQTNVTKKDLSENQINNKEDETKEEINVVDEEKKLVTEIDNELASRLSGKILLQIERNGEGWYLNPEDNRKYYLGRPADAFNIMREVGIGISEVDYNSFNGYAPSNLSGKILLRVEANGEAYYVNPNDLKMHYLGRPADAFNIMRELGLGISNKNIRKIEVGSLD